MAEGKLSNEREPASQIGLEPVSQQKPGAATERRTLEVVHLNRLWTRVLALREGKPVAEEETDWLFDQVLLSGLHLALEETMQYLYRTGPSFEEFEGWILERNNGRIEPER